jgi:YVTN family beta-propeller protein
VVLTHPANWGPFRRGVFEVVPKAAGLDEATLITEPEAAGVHYASAHRLHDGDIVAVYDLGGGTFDATVLRKNPDGVRIVGTPEGIELLGGIDFDDAILTHVNYVGGGALKALDLRDPRTTIALSRLRHDCVQAKEALSLDTETTVQVFLPDHHFEVRLTRTEFEQLIRAQVESTIDALGTALRSAQVAPQDLTAVLLVGGSSRIPLITRMVTEEFGRPILADTNPKYAVALGAATVAGPPTATSHNGDGPAPPTIQRPAPQAAAAPSPPGPTVPTIAEGSTPTPSEPVRTFVAGDAPPSLVAPESRPSVRRRAIFLAAAAVMIAAAAAVYLLPRLSRPSNAVTATVHVGHEPGRVVITPDGRRGYVTDFGSASVSVIDTASNAVATTIAVGPQPSVVAVAPDGRHSYVTNTGSNTVSVIDTASNAVITTVPVGQRPSGVAVTPDSRRLYVADQGSRSVSVVDTASNAVLATVPAGMSPAAVAISPDGRHAYVTDFGAGGGAGQLIVLDTASNAATATVPTGRTPGGVAVAPDGRRVYVSNYDSNTVSVIDATTNAPVSTIPVGQQPAHLSVAPDGRHLYLSCQGANSVWVLDTATDATLATITAPQPNGIATAPDGRHVYVANTGADTLSVIDTN